MLVREIMTSPAFSVTPQDPLDAAVQLMAERRVTCLPVVDTDQHVVGVLSEVDVLRRAIQPDERAHLKRVSGSEALPHTVADIMTGTPRTTTEVADVADLAKLFTETGLKSLPVVNGQRLVGVISRSDVIRALWRPDAELAHEVAAAFQDNGLGQWTTTVEHGTVTVVGPQGDREASMARAVASSVLGVRRVQITPP